MRNKKILFGICGSFCNHELVLKQIKALTKDNEVTCVVSDNVYNCSTRFFKNTQFIDQLKKLTKKTIIHTIVEAEKIGPDNAFNIMVIAPLSANVCSRLANGMYDHPVALAAKAMIRNRKNIVFGIATNDGLGISGVNLMRLLSLKYFYAIPFGQDAPFDKQCSIVAQWDLLIETVNKALLNQQIQPILLGGK